MRAGQTGLRRTARGRQQGLALSPAAVAELLAGLQARGLAAGTAKDDPGPARLTEQGAELFRGLAEAVAPATREVFAGIGQADLATAHRVLRQIIEQAQRREAGSVQGRRRAGRAG